MKKLYKSATNKMISGVCGGIAEYFQVDPTVVRLIRAELTAFNGIGILLYILSAVIIPDDTDMIEEVKCLGHTR